MTLRSLRVSVIVLILAVVSAPAWGQPTTGPSGHWEGAIQVPGQELKIEIDLASTGGKWDGRISIPAQNLKAFPLSSIAVQGDAVSFAMKGIPGDPAFKGTVSKDAKTIAGDFTQGGGSLPFALTRTGEAKIEPLPKSTPIATDLEGSWQGTLDVGGKTLRLALKLANQPGGAATGTMISLDQGAAEIPIAAVVQNGAQVRLLVQAVAGVYEGQLKAGELTGTWTQGPNTWPLVFKRAQ
jgi:hypothetical protein